MSTLLEELALEGRLGRGHWRLLVYLWRRHLQGDADVSVSRLGTILSLTNHLHHLQHRGLVEACADHRWKLSAKGRAAFGLASDWKPETPGGDLHPFLRRDRDQQRAALSAWWESQLKRELVKPLVEHWQADTLASAPKASLDLAERWALKSLTPERAATTPAL